VKVTIRAFGKLLTAVERHFESELGDHTTIQQLFRQLTARNPSILSPLLWDSTLTVLINGRNIYSLQGMNTILRDGDIVTLIPFVVGG
jgi:molybdopterin converting factor small subunit